jgi:hypothetical protein
MTADIRAVVQRATAEPTHPLNIAAISARAHDLHRGRRVRATVTVLVLLAFGTGFGLGALTVARPTETRVSVASPGRGGASTATAPRVYGERVAHTEAWAHRGEELRRSKHEALGAGMYPSFSNDGDFAYPSRPIDITAPGPYTVYFGPVDDWYSPTNPHTQGYASNWPDDRGFNVRPVGGEEIVTLEGQRYQRVNVLVSEENFAPYLGFYGWIS